MKDFAGIGGVLKNWGQPPPLNFIVKPHEEGDYRLTHMAEPYLEMLSKMITRLELPTSKQVVLGQTKCMGA